MTIEKINKLLKDSFVKIYKDEYNDLITFKINYKHQNGKYVMINELEELRNKILMSSTNTNSFKNKEINKNDEQNNLSKEIIAKDYINLTLSN